MPGKAYASIKAPRVYEALRAKGYSKGKSARISNAQAADSEETKLAHMRIRHGRRR